MAPEMSEREYLEGGPEGGWIHRQWVEASEANSSQGNQISTEIAEGLQLF
jgi:hypothetical protein